MSKFLLILSIIAYLLYKVGGFFFKAGASSQQFRQQPPKPGNTVNSNPKDKRDGHIKGGDYIDYEEVK